MDEQKEEALQEEQQKEQQVSELEQKLASLSMEISDYETQKEALEKEISRIKEDLQELRLKRRLEKQEIEEKREEVFAQVFSNLKKLYDLKDEDIAEIRKQLPEDTVDVDFLIKKAKGIYAYLHPEVVEELEKKLEISKQETTQFIEQGVSASSSTYSPELTEGFTEEDLEIAREAGVKPETVKKIKEGKRDEKLLTRGAQEPII